MLRLYFTKEDCFKKTLLTQIVKSYPRNLQKNIFEKFLIWEIWYPKDVVYKSQKAILKINTSDK